MPIRPEFRHFYRGPEWKATRGRILERAGHKCEACGVPNRITALRAYGWWTPASSEATLFMFSGRRAGDRIIQLPWHPPNGGPMQMSGFLQEPCRWVAIVLAVCHVNHIAGDDRDENLRAWCQWCHLHHDRTQHHMTRATRKDASRPLLVAATRPA